MKQAKPTMPWILRKNMDCDLYDLFADAEVINALHEADLDGILNGYSDGRGHYLIEIDPRYNPDDVMEAIREWLAENVKDEQP
jgi:hypothetical protein